MTDVVLCTNKSQSPQSRDSLGWGLYLIQYREYDSLTSGDISSPQSPKSPCKGGDGPAPSEWGMPCIAIYDRDIGLLLPCIVWRWQGDRGSKLRYRWGASREGHEYRHVGMPWRCISL
ncbi:hypothetical protein ACLB2K_047321 [Fragaria x ananassa]